MILTVFGATGQVGLHLVQQGLIKGHQVRAFGRNVHTIPIEDEHLTRIKGAVFDEGEVLAAIEGADAVLSVLGGSFDGLDKTRSLGIKTIVGQMKKAGIMRIIALGGLGILEAPGGGLLIDEKEYPEEYLPVGKEHQKAWETLRDSGLDWTFICSPNIINADPTGDYITSINVPPQPNNFRINSGDLALCMLEAVEKHEFSQQRVGISAL